MNMDDDEEDENDRRRGSEERGTRGAVAGGPGAAGPCTLCVRGLPPDIQPREFRCLVGLLPGFEDSHLATSGARGALGFVRFSNSKAASSALALITAFVVDPTMEPARPLQAQTAKRELQTRPARPGPPRGAVARSAMMPQASMPMSMPAQSYGNSGGLGGFSTYGGGQGGGMQSTMQSYGGGQGAQMQYDRQPAPFYSSMQGQGQDGQSWGQASESPAWPKRPREEHARGGDARGSSPARDTLCIRGIPRSVDESHIRAVLGRTPGFATMNIIGGAGPPTVFALFASSINASQALGLLARESVQDQTGMQYPLQVEFARRSMRA